MSTSKQHPLSARQTQHESDYAPDTLRPPVCARLQQFLLEPEHARNCLAVRLREPRLAPPAPAAPSPGAPPPGAPSCADHAGSCSSSAPSSPRSARSSARAASRAAPSVQLVLHSDFEYTFLLLLIILLLHTRTKTPGYQSRREGCDGCGQAWSYDTRSYATS